MDLPLPLLLEIFGLFLTISVLLYLFFGDNALFRIVTYLFIGVVAGYITILAIFNVLLPRLGMLIFSGNPTFTIIGGVVALLGILLFFKLSPRMSRLGSVSMAILVGVGAAVTIGGAVLGTIFGQVAGTLNLFNVNNGNRLLEGVYILVGVVSTMAYFQFNTRSRVVTPVADEETTAPRATTLEILAKIGQVFIGITLGAMFAGVYTAAITALVERLGFIFETVLSILKLFQ
jgi:hypothetical protein